LLLLRFASQGRLRRDESAARSAVSRTTLRRAVPSFTVEVRRRPRLATTSNPDVQSTETRSPQAGFDRESHRASAAAFGAKKVDRSPVDVAASSPKGRILPSLLPEESLRRPLRDAALTRAESDQPSRVPKRPAVRTLNGKDRASRLPQNSSFSSAENAPVAEGLSTKSHRTSSGQSDEGVGVSRGVAPTVQSQVVGESGGLALRAKTKRSDEIAISRDDVRAEPLLNDQRSTTGTDSPATRPSRADDGSPLGRRRTIMARYVFGDELNRRALEAATTHVAMKRSYARCFWWSIPNRRGGAAHPDGRQGPATTSLRHRAPLSAGVSAGRCNARELRATYRKCLQ
jgi:hypothetical protein